MSVRFSEVNMKTHACVVLQQCKPAGQLITRLEKLTAAFTLITKLARYIHSQCWVRVSNTATVLTFDGLYSNI